MEQFIVSANKQISEFSSEFFFLRGNLCRVRLCVCVCVSMCVERGGYKDPSVGEIDHKPPEQLILSL